MRLDKLIKQKSYEKPVYLLRRHPLIFFKDILLFLMLAGAPYLLYLALARYFSASLTGPYGYPLFILGASVYYLSIWLFFLTQFVDYYLDVWIVTNDRIVNIEQQALFSRTISELDLYKIQDVTSDVKGMLPTFFNYGQVFIQTAGQKERFTFEQVSNPHQIRQRIIDLIEMDRKYHLNQPI